MLLGDFAFQRVRKPDQTDEEKAVEAAGRKKITDLQREWEKLDEPPANESREDQQKRLARLEAIENELEELYEKFETEWEEHGWVWVFLREGPKPPREKLDRKKAPPVTRD